MYTRKKVWLVVIIIVVVTVGIGILHTVFNKPTLQTSSNIVIVLSPHFGDATLALGGLLAQKGQSAVVATFFVGAPSVATTTPADTAAGFSDSAVAASYRVNENAQALAVFGTNIQNYGYVSSQYGQSISDQDQTNLAMDIQTLIAAYSNKKEVDVYGPSEFGSSTDPDTAALSQTFVDVAQSYPLANVHFFFYENYPATEEFNQTSIISLKKSLENDNNLFLTQVSIPLTESQLNKKIDGIKAFGSEIKVLNTTGGDVVAGDQNFTENRCSQNSACEVVYELPTS